MKKSINPQAIEIQRRFFLVLDMAIQSGEIKGGLKGFCDVHKLNRVKYSRIKNDMNKPNEEQSYKIIDLDALAYISEDFGVSTEWLLFGSGEIFKKR